MHFSIPDTQECREDNGSTYIVSIFISNLCVGCKCVGFVSLQIFQDHILPSSACKFSVYLSGKFIVRNCLNIFKND